MRPGVTNATDRLRAAAVRLISRVVTVETLGDQQRDPGERPLLCSKALWVIRLHAVEEELN